LQYGQGVNAALNVISCFGNQATAVTSEVKGSKDVVTGKHVSIVLHKLRHSRPRYRSHEPIDFDIGENKNQN
ncbi:DUF4438 domain-containing protein, partial [Candidatus Bathyarchaeota archaeon]